MARWLQVPLDLLKRWNFKWFHIYYVLAGFDMLTVVASLYLSHAITGMYSQSVAENRLWANRLAQYSELSQLAAEVNAPGNDVFDSRDVAGERGKMLEALGIYAKAMAAVREDLGVLADQRQSAQLTGDVDNIDGVYECHARRGQPDLRLLCGG